ncbi:1-acyl-sn-glycerol-3-phosphate acyltransferase [Polynucleobacter sp. MWH-UH2A]|uniref:lysophospholipid acyltransferase family protein n=1 Tax=Polynucleobacter sp. MWH-UH2A TaxID=1855617 RepID=UPI001BFDB401|nr:lysophospholipid acyltransferase family protein [Polynucleobacter sp. MWH-UH2A]QWD63694.1 1-acyl-sn-glycerol-3-phosphate acyltransferase [Polynucleobacter sp. MWH-UH2A]
MPSLNQAPHTKTPLLIQSWCWLRIALHVVYGLLLLSIRFPFAQQRTKDQYIQSWSLTLLSIFGITLRIRNQEILPSTPYMLAANHISWMDIHAINAFKPIRFVAKSEVASWPIFGWMARQLGTVFIRRDSTRHGKHIAGELGTLLHHESVCIFPEGTSTSGGNALPFKPNLFEAAVLANTPVFSLAISYKSSLTNQRTEVPAFIGDMGLLESICNMLRDRHLLVELVFLLPAGSSPDSPKDRKWLALHSQEAIAAQLSSDNSSM